PGTSLLLTALEVYMIVHLSKSNESNLGLKEIGYSAMALYGLSTVLVTALVLFGIGFYKARVTVGKPTRSGLEMMLIGTISAMAGYLVGVLLKVPPMP
ncbi:MAG: VIT1/CCC1 transporter family protein, partial [Anaerolineae bacterium]